MDKVSFIGDDVIDYWISFGENEEHKLRLIKLLSSGGSCLIYRAEYIHKEKRKQCVVKEYYPDEENISHKVRYVRKNPGEFIKIISVSGKESDRIEELKRQQDNINRELYINQELFYNKNTLQGNNPYIYRADFVKQLGDSSYLVLDTAEGMTLKEYLHKTPENRLDWNTAIQYTLKMLEVVRYINLRGCVHGDISLDNFWIAGENENQYFQLLDFGSAFFENEYHLDELSDEAVLEMADKIINHSTLGFSHENTRSGLIGNLLDAKIIFNRIRTLEYAKQLVQVMNEVDIRADIHSVIKLFYLMVVGEAYDSCSNMLKISKALGETKVSVLSQKLLTMMKSNDKLEFTSIKQVSNYLTQFLQILNKECVPECLIQGIQEELNPVECNISLFAPIIEERKPINYI